MNLLEDRLQHANGAVVLTTIKLFLQLTLSKTDVHQQVYERIKARLLTLVSSGSPEQSYAVLSHLYHLVMRAPMLFASDYKHFYCQYNEPFFVKKLKLEMLTAVANESNTYEIGSCKGSFTKLPSMSHDCIAVIGNISSNNVQEPKAKAAIIWMLGEYAQDMQDAPYALEGLIDEWEDESSPEVRLHLLTAVMKCFYRRPPEIQKALGSALAAGLADMHQDVHDRALFYYRLLQHNVSVANSVVNPPKQAVSVFADTQSNEIKDCIFDEFNSLSIYTRSFLVLNYAPTNGSTIATRVNMGMTSYIMPCYMFTDKQHQRPFAFSEDLGNLSIGSEPATDVILPTANDQDLLLSNNEKEDSRAHGNNNSAYDDSQGALASLNQTEPTHTRQANSNPAIDDLFGLGLSITPTPAPLKLNAKAVLDPSTFQQKWRQLPVSTSQELLTGSKLFLYRTNKLTGSEATFRTETANRIRSEAQQIAP